MTDDELANRHRTARTRARAAWDRDDEVAAAHWQGRVLAYDDADEVLTDKDRTLVLHELERRAEVADALGLKGELTWGECLEYMRILSDLAAGQGVVPPAPTREVGPGPSRQPGEVGSSGGVQLPFSIDRAADAPPAPRPEPTTPDGAIERVMALIQKNKETGDSAKLMLEILALLIEVGGVVGMSAWHLGKLFR